MKEETRLVIQHTDLVKSRAAHYAKFRFPHASAEDLEQEGMIGLLEAIRSFDPARGATLRTYAHLLVSRYMRRLIGETDGKLRIRYTQSLNEDIFDDEGDTRIDRLASTDPSPEEQYSKAETARLVRRSIHKLTDREKEVISMRFDQEMTLDEAASKLPIGRSRVDQIEKQAVQSIRDDVGLK